MSTEHREFLRRLWIVLISVMGPFIIAGTLNAVIDHTNIKAMQRHLDVLEDTYVSRDILLLYMNEIRLKTDMLEEAIYDNGNEHMEIKAQMDLIRKRQDKLIEELYKTRTRGPNFDSLTLNGH